MTPFEVGRQYSCCHLAYWREITAEITLACFSLLLVWGYPLTQVGCKLATLLCPTFWAILVFFYQHIVSSTLVPPCWITKTTQFAIPFFFGRSVCQFLPLGQRVEVKVTEGVQGQMIHSFGPLTSFWGQ